MEESHNQIVLCNVVKHGIAPPISGFYLGKQIYLIVCFAKIILYIVIKCFVAKFLELILKGSALLKEAMYLTFYLHLSLL